MELESETESLKRRLAEADENLRLVRERKSEFVRETSIPLQLIKDERRLVQEIRTLRAQLAQDGVEVDTDPHDGEAIRLSGRPEQQLNRRWLVRMGRILGSRVFQGIVAVLAVVIALGAWFWPNISTHLFPSATEPPTSSSSIPYQVRVQAKDTGEYVQGAEVTIEVGGKAPLNGITDSHGLARIYVPSSHIDEPGVLRVEATGYERYVQNIDLTEDALPDVVQLESAS